MTRSYADSPWADENNISELRRLWPLPDWSASRIADHLGVTRNSVISKAHRLCLKSYPNPIKNPGSGSKRHRKKKPEPDHCAIVDLRSMWPRTGDSAPRTYVRRKRGLDYSCDRPSDYATCQFPLWDDEPDGRFCGAGTVKGRNFCQEHCQVVYRRNDAHVLDYRRGKEGFAKFINDLDANGPTLHGEPYKMVAR